MKQLVLECFELTVGVGYLGLPGSYGSSCALPVTVAGQRTSSPGLTLGLIVVLMEHAVDVDRYCSEAISLFERPSHTLPGNTATVTTKASIQNARPLYSSYRWKLCRYTERLKVHVAELPNFSANPQSLRVHFWVEHPQATIVRLLVILLVL